MRLQCWFRWTGISGILIVLSVVLYPVASGLEQKTDAWISCRECHAPVVTAFTDNPHRAVDRRKVPGRGAATDACAACHGDAAAHMETFGSRETIFAFDSTVPVTEKTGRCLACHTGGMGSFLLSPHGLAVLDCSACHRIHATPEKDHLLIDGQTATCSRCHPGIEAQFRWTEHHRLIEGVMECSSCHNPHAPALNTRLSGFKRELCTRCHTDRQGPFLHEHAAVRIDGCSACHEPHGSPNRHLLKQQQVADLCYSCHIRVSFSHMRFNRSTQCTTCHNAIHGSNLSPLFLK